MREQERNLANLGDLLQSKELSLKELEGLLKLKEEQHSNMQSQMENAQKFLNEQSQLLNSKGSKLKELEKLLREREQGHREVSTELYIKHNELAQLDDYLQTSLKGIRQADQTMEE